MQGGSQERGESHYVPGTGEKLVRLCTIFSPVPGTFTPNWDAPAHDAEWSQRIKNGIVAGAVVRQESLDIALCI